MAVMGPEVLLSASRVDHRHLGVSFGNRSVAFVQVRQAWHLVLGLARDRLQQSSQKCLMIRAIAASTGHHLIHAFVPARWAIGDHPDRSTRHASLSSLAVVMMCCKARNLFLMMGCEVRSLFLMMSSCGKQNPWSQLGVMTARAYWTVMKCLPKVRLRHRKRRFVADAVRTELHLWLVADSWVMADRPCRSPRCHRSVEEFDHRWSWGNSFRFPLQRIRPLYQATQ